MDLSVIENDPKEVKKYLQNFVPINYYKVLDDAYLYQIRAVLLHSVSHAELYNPVYAGLINDLTVTSGKNYANVTTKIEGLVDNFSALATKTETLEVEAANANASIIEIQQASAEQNKAQASINQRLEASLDDIVVGGRNIMKNSDFSKGYRAWQEASITKHNHFIGTMHKISTTGIVGSLMGIYPLAEYQNMAMVEGTQYSISFYAYGSILLMDEIYLTSPSEAPIKLPSVVISTDLSERRHITFTAPTGGGGLGLIFGATATSEDDWFSISRIKVELGNKPTDWTPAPEDVEGYINEVQSSIDTFKDVQVERNLATAQAIEKMDTRVKGNAASILEEKNTRVDQFSALSQVTNELTSKTNENEAAIKTVDLTFTDRYNANVSRLGVLEADNSLGKGKIENLESVTTSLGEVVVTQSSTLNAKIDNLTMGGRNLLRNSDFKLGADTWGTSELSYDDSIFGNLTTITNTGTTADYFGLQPVNIFKTVTLIKDKEYVLSFYAKGNIPSINDIWITAEGELPQQIDSVDITDGISDRYSVVFTANHTTEAGSIIIGASGYAKGKWFAVAAVKLEIGNKASDWTEAPEDSKALIHDVEANINEFKEVQVTYNEANAKQLLELTAKTDDNIAEISELREVTSNVEGSTAALETKLRGEYTSAISSTKSDITKETDGKIDLVNQTLTEMTTDISSKADITRVDSVENNAKQSLATAKTDLTSSYTSAISTAKTESATDATNKANKAKTDANTYTDGKVTTLTKLVNSKADISRVDEVENNALKSVASTKTEITSEYTSAISTSKEESAVDAQIKADKALADANIVTATKATEAQEAAEVYALAKAKAEADAALALAKGDATSKSNAAKSAAIAAAALDAKNKADKALADAKLDATAKADAAKKYAKDLVDTLTTVVNSKADITRVDKVVNDSTQALAQAKTDITGAYTLAITESSELSAADAKAKADKALADAAIKATAAQTAAETYALAQANAKAAAALDSAKSDATTKANKAKADAELAAAADAKKKADEALRLAKLDATAKANAVKDMVVALTKEVDSKASISRVDDIENNATQALATAKTELTSSYTTAITTAKNQSATDAKTKADAALAAAKIDAQTKATAAKTAAETYALAEAKAKADAALVLAKSDATTKANAAKSAAEATAALDAKNKADKALADAKVDATAKANAAKTYADGIVKTLKTTVDSKASITQLNTVKNDANQALATAKTELTGSYTSAITEVRNDLTDYTDLKSSVVPINSTTKKFINPVGTIGPSSATGYLIIETPITPSRMCTVKFSGYNYSGSISNIDLSVGFYHHTSGTLQTDFNSTGSYPIEKVQIGRSSDTTAVIIIGLPKSVWKYVRGMVSEAIIGYSGDTPDSYINGWNISFGTDISSYTLIANVPGSHIKKDLSDLKTVVDSKATISRVDTVENDAKKALASAKTELTGSYTSAIATAKSQSATDAQTKATKALTDAKADTVIKANAAESAAKTYALAEAKAKADAALVSAKSDSTTKANAAESAAKSAAALDAKNKADKALADAKIDSTAKANEAERLAKAHADTKVTALTKIVDSKASISSVESVENTANKAIATLRTDLKASYSVKDTRSVNSTPDWYRANYPNQTTKEFKLLSTIGISGQGTYGLLETSISYASDWSGGPAYQTVYPIDNTVWKRTGTGTTWSAWVQQEDIIGSAAKVAALKTALDKDIKAVDARVTSEKKIAADATSAVASTVGTLTTTVGNNTTKISQEVTARSNADTALGKRITDTDAIAKNAQSRVGTAETAISNANSAIATTKTDLTAAYKKAIDDIEIGGRNLLLDSQKWVAQKGTNTILGVDNVGSLGIGGAQVFNASQIYSHRLMAGETYTWSMLVASKGSITNVTLYTGNVFSYTKLTNIENINTSGFVKVWVTAKVTGTNVTSSRFHFAVTGTAGSLVYFTNLKVEKGNKATDWLPAPEDVDTKINTTDARVTAEKKVAADATSAVAKTVGTLTTTVNGHTSSINETKTSLDGISAKWAMETNVNGKISGIYQHSTGKSSSFEILADKFSVGTDTRMVKPFTISGSDIVFNGKVSFNSVTGTVSSSQIPNGTIKLDHMVTADKNKINTASTTAASAQTKANQAATAAATADKKAVTATTNAATAQTKANQAATAASTADGKAVAAQNEANTLKKNIYFPNTTTIDGGKIRTGSITAASGAIGNLAVTTANLANLAVTTGKIANLAVDTLQINDYAVTIPRTSVVASQTFAKNSNWTRLHSLTMSQTSGTITAFISFDSIMAEYHSTIKQTFGIRVLVNSNAVKTWDIGTNRNSNGFSYTDFKLLNFPYVVEVTNSATIEIQVKAPNDAPITVTGASLALIGSKK